MKLQKAALPRYAWRALLVALLAGGVLLFGSRYGQAWRRSRSLPPAGPPRVTTEVGFEALEGSSLLRAYDCVFNGEEAQFAQFRSTHPAREVIAQFEKRHGKAAASSSPTKGTMVRVAAPAYAAAGAVDDEGHTLGIVAFEEPKRGGSVYFIGRSRSRTRGWRHGDVAGDEVPGIPRPPSSRRVFCIDGLGGFTSRLLVYEGDGAMADAVDRFAAEMPKAGWRRNADVERIVQKRLEGQFLSFLNGTRRAMIYIERDAATNKLRTAVAYSVKGWLPPDRGL